MRYVLTVVETETGAWGVVDPTGRQVWASPSFRVACQRAAADLDDQARMAGWSSGVSERVRRANRARTAAWAAR